MLGAGARGAPGTRLQLGVGVQAALVRSPGAVTDPSGSLGS